MGTYILSRDEKELADRFRESHRNCTLDTLYRSTVPWWKKILIRFFPSYFKFGGPYPSHFDYIFTPTGIGVGVSIRCNYCGEVKDITDYSEW